MRAPTQKRRAQLTGYAQFTRTNLPVPDTRDVSVSSLFVSTGLNHPGPPYREAGPWIQSTDFIGCQAPSVNYATGLVRGYGTLLVYQWPSKVSKLTMFPNLTDSEERSIGTRLQNAARPSKPVADMAVALAELRRDGIPDVPGVHTWRQRTKTVRDAGPEYLNVEFGWSPLVSDIKKFLHAVKDADRILAGYRGQANTWSSRRLALPTESKSAFEPSASGQAAPTNANKGWQGSVFQSCRKEVWFAGLYRYYLPLGDDLISRMERYKKYANKLLGVRLDPVVLWETAPWSWAVDWFADVGQIIQSVSNMGPDADVVKNGCLMWRNSWEATITGEISGGYSFVTVMRKQTQNRRLSTPWGFMINGWNSLTARQFAIMGALGLSGARDIPLTAR